MPSDGLCEKNAMVMTVLHLSRSAVITVVAQARCKNVGLSKQVTVRVGVFKASTVSSPFIDYQPPSL